MKYSFILFFMLLVSGCSLLKIETEQVPLTNYEVNIRELLQRQGVTSIELFNNHCDSLLYATNSIQEKQSLIRLKLNFLSGIESSMYQNPPIYALVDTWIFIGQVDELLSSDRLKYDGINHNMKLDSLYRGFCEFSKSTLRRADYKQKLNFVSAYIKEHKMTSIELDKSSPLDAYLQSEQIPDTAFIHTTGTLPQVMSDMNNRITFKSGAVTDKLRMESKLLALKAGVDSVNVQATLDSIQIQFDRFNTLVQQTPDQFHEEMQHLIQNVSPLLVRIDRQWGNTLTLIHHERVAVDSLIARERFNMDQLIAREREIAYQRIDDMAVNVTKQAMSSVEDMVSSVLIYVILFFIVILVVPFAMGFLSGRWSEKHKNRKK
ncbi:hypothetical protein K4L44_14355 [Halosquirtibacter laminarini]|uniref:Uncharacterized protein n=1 Tax=Halosquirtibacter laminarini TaxID=3374600 RepID=A0AC61NDU0_9BACT|nr:hypothetical protein K4L44_14355 [Prolixibacteraceae bacterium]